MISAFRSLFHRQPPAPSAPFAEPARRLAAEAGAEFFTWFHLEPDGGPASEGDGIRHRFRPAGEAFRALVGLDVTVDAADAIRSARLCLDRSFVNGPQDAFARDIARSFLMWILDDAAQAQAAPLIANIGSFAAANGPVITAHPLPQPPVDPTDAYAVFTGDDDAAWLALGSATLALTNDGGCLIIDVALAA